MNPKKNLYIKAPQQIKHRKRVNMFVLWHCKWKREKGKSPAVTKRRLYCMRLWARPLGFFFLSCLATLGVCPLTFPARASDPCTFPGERQRQLNTITELWLHIYNCIYPPNETLYTHPWLLPFSSFCSWLAPARTREKQDSTYLGFWLYTSIAKKQLINTTSYGTQAKITRNSPQSLFGS